MNLTLRYKKLVSCLSNERKKIIGWGIEHLNILKLVFVLNKWTANSGYYWKIKWEKYYVPLFRYYKMYRQNMELNNRFENCRLYKKLLINEIRNEITLIPRIAVIVTTRCTLKCRKCASLIPYFEKQEDINYKEIIEDIKAIEKQVDRIYCLELVGGEPFLHPDLDIMLKYLKKSEKIGVIEITTNAVVKISEKVLVELKDPKVIVKISVYGFNKKSIIEMINIFKQMSIKYQILRQEQWWDFGQPKDYKRSSSEINRNFYKCFASSLCRGLYKGKLMICGRGPFLYEQGYISNQYLDIRGNGLDAKMLYDFYINMKYNFCGFCDYKGKSIRVAEQLKR